MARGSQMGRVMGEDAKEMLNNLFTFSFFPHLIPSKNYCRTVLVECTRDPWEKLNGPHGTTRDL